MKEGHTRLLAVCVALLLATSFLTTFVVVGSAATAGNTATGTATGTPTATAGPTPTATPTTTTKPTTTATATPSDDATATPEPAASGGGSDGEESEFTYSELKQDGPHQANSPPGVRMGDKRAFWAVYWPANNPFADTGSVEGGKYLPSGHTVGRNALYLRTWTYDDIQRTVHVVYWNKGSDEITRGNTTSSETVAENVTHVTHQVTFDRGRPTVKIPLRQHDTPVQATMWIEGEGYARWTFQHHSVATTQSVAIDSAGDYLTSVIFDFLIWIVVGGFVAGTSVKKALERAGIGPQYGYVPWIAGLTLFTGLGTILAYQSLADLVVNAKFVLAAYVVAIFAVILLETYTTRVSSALFLRPTLSHTKSPSGADAYDLVDAEARSEKIVRGPDGTVSVVTPGLFAFLARVFGRKARLENIEKLRTRVNLQNSSWDELFIADPEADQLLEYEKEGWTLSLPPIERETAPQYLVGAGAVLLAVLAYQVGAASGPALTGALAVGFAAWVIQPRDGYAFVRPANIHLREAFGTMVRAAEDIDDAKRFDELKAQLDSERVRKQRDVDQEVARHDATLVEEMLDPDEAVPAAVDDPDTDGSGGDPSERDPDDWAADTGAGRVDDE
jgi:hypothetical protein